MPMKPPNHRPRTLAPARKGSTARGYSSRWQRYRKAFLMQHPLCECAECQAAGRVLAATDVDHVVPVRGEMDPRFWDASNHMALSHRCHSRKTARERQGG